MGNYFRAEVVFERKLRRNRFYPFYESTDKPVLICSLRYKTFYWALLFSLICALFTVVWPLAGGDKQYLVLSGGGLFAGVYVVLEYCIARTIVLDRASSHYSVYRGSKLIVTQHLHNIYVRLISKDTGSKYPLYYLALDGCGLELPVVLTGDSTNRKKLRHLGYQLVSNILINYFDAHNSSKHHIIYHVHKRNSMEEEN